MNDWEDGLGGRERPVADVAKHAGVSTVENGRLSVGLEDKYTMDSLKPVLSQYLEVNKRLTDQNNKAGELRDQRRSLELDLTAVYHESRIKEPLPDKIELNASHMVFHVKKPGEWKKGWTLSKKQLQEYLTEILPEHGTDVMREIVRRHEPTLTANDYSFELKTMD